MPTSFGTRYGIKRSKQRAAQGAFGRNVKVLAQDDFWGVTSQPAYVNFSFAGVTLSPTGWQEISAEVRKTGSGENPAVRIELYETGGTKPILTLVDSVRISSTTGQTVTGAWRSSALQDATGASVEARVIAEYFSSARLDIGFIDWGTNPGTAVSAAVLISARCSGTSASFSSPIAQKQFSALESGVGREFSTPTVERRLSARTSGTGLDLATPTQERRLSARTSGTGSDLATPSAERRVSALTIGSAGREFASLSAQRTLSASARGVGTELATATAERRLSGVTWGKGSHLASPSPQRLFSALSSGLGWALASEQVGRLMSAVTQGAALAFSTPQAMRLPSGLLSGSALDLASITRTASLSAFSSASSQARSEVERIATFSGLSPGEASYYATLLDAGVIAISGGMVGVSTLLASAISEKRISSQARGNGAHLGSPLRTASLSARSNGASAFGASPYREAYLLGAHLNGQGSTYNTIDVERILSALANGTSLSGGTLEIILTGTVLGVRPSVEIEIIPLPYGLVLLRAIPRSGASLTPMPHLSDIEIRETVEAALTDLPLPEASLNWR